MADRKQEGLNNYDVSMLKKVKAWFSNTIYANTAITYNTIYNLLDGVENKMKVPLINIYRPTGFELVPMQAFTARKQGVLINTVDGLGLGARYITVNLMYQLDVYAKTPEDINNMLETIIKTFNFYPEITLIHKDNKTGREFKETYEIEYLSGPHEQSEFNNDDRVYRQYIQYTIKNAKIYDFTDYAEIIETDVNIEVESET